MIQCLAWLKGITHSTKWELTQKHLGAARSSWVRAGHCWEGSHRGAGVGHGLGATWGMLNDQIIPFRPSLV